MLSNVAERISNEKWKSCMNKRIGILTFTEGDNFGQRLQNYALQSVLEQMECNVYTIRQSIPLKVLLREVKKTRKRHLSQTERVQRWNREKKFRAFDQMHIHFYGRVMPFHGRNTWGAKDFDVFIVGSDQVWNPHSPYVGSNFFLSFAPPQKRLTYAPSFSVEEIPATQREKYTAWLRGFSSLTVREDKGAEIIRKLTGQKAEVVLDPTLLLTARDYNAISVKSSLRVDSEYILALFLGTAPPRNEVEKIGMQENKPVLWLNPFSDVGPAEFLDLVRASKIVITDSYHGTIFSVLYHKPFINFMRSGIGCSMSSRFKTLYRILGIEEQTKGLLERDQYIAPDLDYDNIERILTIEKERCLSILRQQLYECGK